VELIIFAPKEDGFIKTIDWNFEDLKKEITERSNDYMNLVYDEDQIQDAKKDRASLNNFKKTLEDKRKEVKKQVMDPYTVFEAQIKELTGIIDKAVGNIDSQIKGYEEVVKQEKEKRCRELFAEHIGDLDRTVPYEAVYNPKWLNKTYGEKTIIDEIKAFSEKVDRELKLIQADTSPYVFEMKEEYLKSFDFSMAMALKQRLEEQARKKALFEEQERKRKEEAEKAKALREERERQLHEERERQRQELQEQYKDEPPEEPKPLPNITRASEPAEKRIKVTIEVIAKESKFDALNNAISLLSDNSEQLRVIKREVLTNGC